MYLSSLLYRAASIVLCEMWLVEFALDMVMNLVPGSTYQRAGNGYKIKLPFRQHVVVWKPSAHRVSILFKLMGHTDARTTIGGYEYDTRAKTYPSNEDEEVVADDLRNYLAAFKSDDK
jgi:hypothetical protein